MTVVRGLFNVPQQRPDGGQTLLFRCPGCRHVHGPTIGPGQGPRWTFNGDYDRPVFGPSLLVTWPQHLKDGSVKNHVCHSFIGCNGAQPGQIVFLGDCTHELAGKVADIPPFSWGDE